MVFDPFAIDRDVALEEMETLLRQKHGNAIGLDIHSVDFPVGRRDDSPRQMMANEAVDAEYQDAFHFSFNLGADPKRASTPTASIGAPSISNAQINRVPPPAQRTLIRQSLTSMSD